MLTQLLPYFQDCINVWLLTCERWWAVMKIELLAQQRTFYGSVLLFFLTWCGRLQIESQRQDQAWHSSPCWIHYSHSSSPVSAAVCSVGHQGGWGGPHHLPRYGLPKDWSANRPRGMPWLKQWYVGHGWNWKEPSEAVKSTKIIHAFSWEEQLLNF